MDPKELTPKHKAFADAYMGEANGDASLAAEMAGYSSNSKKYLYKQGSKLLGREDIRAYISSVVEKSPMSLSRDKRLELLSRIALAEEYETTTNRDGELVTKPPAIRDRIKAIDTLNKMAGEYVQQVNVSGGLRDLEQFADYYSERTDST